MGLSSSSGEPVAASLRVGAMPGAVGTRSRAGSGTAVPSTRWQWHHGFAAASPGFPPVRRWFAGVGGFRAEIFRGETEGSGSSGATLG